MTYETLTDLRPGEASTVSDLLTEGAARRRLLDLGLVKGTRVKALYAAPSGSPVAYYFRGTVIALRRDDAGRILINEKEGLTDGADEAVDGRRGDG